jgi:hypothetical protein
LAICVLDVGSLKSLGWWWTGDGATASGSTLAPMIEKAAGHLTKGGRVALGIEAPLWVPLPDSEDGLCRQRLGEAGRPWSASAGTITLALGIQQLAWTLRELRTRTSSPLSATVSWERFAAAESRVLIWEAFVTGKAKPTIDAGHIADARVAGEAFVERMASGAPFSDLGPQEAINIAFLAALRAGVEMDSAEVEQEPIVVRVAVAAG